jgi:kynureninase
VIDSGSRDEEAMVSALLSALDGRSGGIGGLWVHRSQQRNACSDIVGWSSSNVNERQNSFVAAMQASRSENTAIRATSVSMENSFPILRG